MRSVRLENATAPINIDLSAVGHEKRDHLVRRSLLILDLGGDEGDRTPDLCNAIAALSQLSYVPLV